MKKTTFVLAPLCDLAAEAIALDHGDDPRYTVVAADGRPPASSGQRVFAIAARSSGGVPHAASISACVALGKVLESAPGFVRVEEAVVPAFIDFLRRGGGAALFAAKDIDVTLLCGPTALAPSDAWRRSELGALAKSAAGFRIVRLCADDGPQTSTERGGAAGSADQPISVPLFDLRLIEAVGLSRCSVADLLFGPATALAERLLVDVPTAARISAGFTMVLVDFRKRLAAAGLRPRRSDVEARARDRGFLCHDGDELRENFRNFEIIDALDPTTGRRWRETRSVGMRGERTVGEAVSIARGVEAAMARIRARALSL